MRQNSNESGAALIMAIIVIAVLTLLGLALLFTTSTEFQIAGAETNVNKSFYAAESGVQYAIAKAKNGQLTNVAGCTTPDGKFWSGFWCITVPQQMPNVPSKTLTVRVAPMSQIDQRYSGTSDYGTKLCDKTFRTTSTSQDWNSNLSLNVNQKTITVDFSLGDQPCGAF